MTFYVDNNPSPSEIASAINYLLANFAQTTAINPNSGQITSSGYGVVSYLYKYLNVKYADSFDGILNFSNSPTGRTYYGLRNNDSSIESTNPVDYVWTLVTGGFGTTKNIYYATTGGRQIQYVVATAKPSASWLPDTGAAIDLDFVTYSNFDELTALAPRAELGTMSPQNAEKVNITGGAINGTPIGATNSATGKFSYLTVDNYEDWTALSAPTYSAGRVWYDSTQNTLAYYNDIANNLIHLGQEVQVKVINNTGSSIPIGSPVYITGTSSGFAYPNIALAKADVQATSAVIGLTTQAIANGAAGYVTTEGILQPCNTGAFTVGQILYLSPYSAGQLMNTMPPTGYAVRVGIVAYSNTPNGAIYVRQANNYVNAPQIVGQVAIANGGTNSTATPTTNGIAYGTGTAYAFTAAGTTGQVLTATTGSAPTWAAPAYTGTVTSVSFTGGIITVATPTSTPAFTVAGTSGGIPYFSSSTTWASSAALTQYGVVYGGGAGAAPVATAAGTTGQVLTATTGAAPTWAAPATSGTVTSVSVVSANGFAGTVATSTTTPAITLTTSVTGVLKGNGTAISAATANTDYQGVSAPVTKTADFTVGATDIWLINNKSGSTCTATLPAASSWSGRVLRFLNYQAQTLVSASSNVVPLTGGSAATSILLASTGDSATLVSDGTNWLMTQYIPNNILLLE